jgi:hypothetical protein
VAALLGLIRVGRQPWGRAGVAGRLAALYRLPDHRHSSGLPEPDQVVDLGQHRPQLGAAELPQHRSDAGQGFPGSGQRVPPLTSRRNRLHGLKLDATTDSQP